MPLADPPDVFLETTAPGRAWQGCRGLRHRTESNLPGPRDPGTAAVLTLSGDLPPPQLGPPAQVNRAVPHREAPSIPGRDP